MLACGYRTIRVYAKEVLSNLDGVMKYLEKEIKKFPL